MFLTRASGLTTGCFLYIVGHENCGQIPDFSFITIKQDEEMES
jgi:hypothetical protein